MQFLHQPSYRRPEKTTDSLRIVGVLGEILTGYMPSALRQSAWCLETSTAFVFVCSRHKRAAGLARCEHVLAELAERCAQCLSCVLQNTARLASGKGVNVSALTLAVCVQY